MIELNVGNTNAKFVVQDYKQNTWHTICATWDSESGLGQLWFDGNPSIRKFIGGSNITRPIVILGQVSWILKHYSISEHRMPVKYWFQNKKCTALKVFFRLKKKNLICIHYRSRIHMVVGLTWISLSSAWCLMFTCGTTPSHLVRFSTMWMT